MERRNAQLDDQPTVALRDRGVRARMGWTAVLVLIALGGAGLVVAADRPHDPDLRPELTWRADRSAHQWLRAIAAELAALQADLSALSAEARAVLGHVQALRLAPIRAAVARGDEISAGLAARIATVAGLRDDALGQIEEWRLGPPTRAALDAVIGAVSSTGVVPGSWETLTGHAARVAELVDVLARHDALVFRATSAGRQAQWDQALDFLFQAEVALGEARDIRDELAIAGEVATLDDLLARYDAYDIAIIELYQYIRETGRREGREFEQLEARLERATAALPADTTAMSLVVAEAAGSSMTAALVSIEQARGDILDAVATAQDVVS